MDGLSICVSLVWNWSGVCDIIRPRKARLERQQNQPVAALAGSVSPAAAAERSSLDRTFCLAALMCSNWRRGCFSRWDQRKGLLKGGGRKAASTGRSQLFADSRKHSENPVILHHDYFHTRAQSLAQGHLWDGTGHLAELQPPPSIPDRRRNCLRRL